MTDKYDHWIQKAVETHLPGYDWRLYKAQLWQESKLDPDAKSPAGAVGVAQFMEQTWLEWSPKSGYAGYERTDPEASIFTGAAYMYYLINAWYWPRPEIDRYCLAMASYNAGKGNIIEAQSRQGNPSLYHEIIKGLDLVTGQHSEETIGYVRNILGFYYQQILEGEV